MKKIALAPTLLILLLLLIYGVHIVEVAEANFVPSSPSIIFDSPLENGTYATSFVWLDITLKTWFDPGNVSRIVECFCCFSSNNSV